MQELDLCSSHPSLSSFLFVFFFGWGREKRVMRMIRAGGQSFIHPSPSLSIWPYIYIYMCVCLLDLCIDWIYMIYLSIVSMYLSIYRIYLSIYRIYLIHLSYLSIVSIYLSIYLSYLSFVSIYLSYPSYPSIVSIYLCGSDGSACGAAGLYVSAAS